MRIARPHNYTWFVNASFKAIHFYIITLWTVQSTFPTQEKISSPEAGFRIVSKWELTFSIYYNRQVTPSSDLSPTRLSCSMKYLFFTQLIGQGLTEADDWLGKYIEMILTLLLYSLPVFLSPFQIWRMSSTLPYDRVQLINDMLSYMTNVKNHNIK